MVILPALTLWQPWACLIEIRAKRFETRSFPIPNRLLGKRVAIHAAARKMRLSDIDGETADAIGEAFGFCGWNYSLPRGVIVATAILAESIPAENVERDHFGDYSPGRWAWRLEDVHPVNPHIPAKGRQQIGWPCMLPGWEASRGATIEHRLAVELGMTVVAAAEIWE